MQYVLLYYKKSKRHLKVYYLVLQYPEPTNFAKPPDGKTGHRSRNGTEKLQKMKPAGISLVFS